MGTTPRSPRHVSEVSTAFDATAPTSATPRGVPTGGIGPTRAWSQRGHRQGRGSSCVSRSSHHRGCRCRRPATAGPRSSSTAWLPASRRPATTSCSSPQVTRHAPVPKAFVRSHAAPEQLGKSFVELHHLIHAYEAVRDFDIVHDHTITGPIYAKGHSDAQVVTTNHGPFTEELDDIYSR